MSKRFFSLIRGDTLHLAQKTKIIPSESFSTVLEAKDVLEHVKKDAEQYKLKVASECEMLKEKAAKDGFEQGYAEWVSKIADLDEEIKKVRQDTESVIIPIAMKAAKKIVGRELEISQKTVVDIISSSLKSVATHKRIKIYVNKKELDLMEKYKEEIKKIFEHLESLSILSQDDIQPGGCLIETEGGIINAQLENQWLILESAFQKLITPKKAQPIDEAAKKLEESKKSQGREQPQADRTKIEEKSPSSKAGAPDDTAKEEEEDEDDDDWDDDEDDWGDEKDEDWEEDEKKSKK